MSYTLKKIMGPSPSTFTIVDMLTYPESLVHSQSCIRCYTTCHNTIAVVRIITIFYEITCCREQLREWRAVREEQEKELRHVQATAPRKEKEKAVQREEEQDEREPDEGEQNEGEQVEGVKTAMDVEMEKEVYNC